MYFPEGSVPEKHSPIKDADVMPKSALRGSLTPADKEDIQTLYNNLANVISECTEQKDRIDVRIYIYLLARITIIKTTSSSIT